MEFILTVAKLVINVCCIGSGFKTGGALMLQV